MKLSYLPNIVTGFRILLLVPFMYTLLHGQYVATFYIFVIAGFSDGLDGWLARRFNWQSRLGGFMDPLSDKLFVSISYLTLGWLHQIPWWLVYIVLTRDVVIVCAVGLWQCLVGPVEFKPTFLSKTNTVLQGFVIFTALFQMAYFAIPVWLFNSLLIVITSTTCASLLHYLYLACDAYRQIKKKTNAY